MHNRITYVLICINTTTDLNIGYSQVSMSGRILLTSYSKSIEANKCHLKEQRFKSFIQGPLNCQSIALMQTFQDKGSAGHRIQTHHTRIDMHAHTCMPSSLQLSHTHTARAYAQIHRTHIYSTPHTHAHKPDVRADADVSRQRQRRTPHTHTPHTHAHTHAHTQTLKDNGKIDLTSRNVFQY